VGVASSNPQIHPDEGFGHMFRKVKVVSMALVVSFPLRHILLVVRLDLDLSHGLIAVDLQKHL